MPDLDREEFSPDDIKIHHAESVDQPVEASPYAAPVEIIVDGPAWSLMNRHAREDLRHEAGGVMLGEIYHHDGGVVVRITTAVAAREAVNSMASIQFTYDAWSQMEKERQKHAPTEKLVGWYHTHPGFSAFFSETDRFMHQHFFTQPWHVALVIDPINEEHRFYRWDGGRVEEATDFLLQVGQGPGPVPSLNAMLSSVLRRAASQADGDDAQRGNALGSALRKLVGSLRRSPGATPLEDLLPFLVASAELPEEAIDEARRRLQGEVVPDSPIRPGDLAYSSSNHNPSGAISIAYGWLVQAVDGRHLHVHGVEESQAFCGHVLLPKPAIGLALEEEGSVMVLTADPVEPLWRMSPSLPALRGKGSHEGDEPGRLEPVEIDWEGHQPASKIGQVLAGRRVVYLLMRSRLAVLEVIGHQRPPSLRCRGIYDSAACGWESFADLTDWSTDLNGNLFLLRAASKEVWEFDRLAGRWTRFSAIEDVERPVSLAVGMTALSIYDAGSSSIVQYGRFDGRLLCRRRLEEGFHHFRVRRLFSDGYQQLYLVTDKDIYRTR